MRKRLLLLLPTYTYRAEAFVDAVDRLDVDLTVASEVDSAFSTSENEGLLTLDFSDPAAAADQVRRFARDHPIDAVFGVDDRTAGVAAVIADGLGLSHSPPHAVAAAGDKFKQREILSAAGVPVPAYSLERLADPADEVARRARYPCVLKPLDLSASRGVFRVDDPRAFADAHARLTVILESADLDGRVVRRDSYLIERYVPGAEYALEGAIVGGELRTLAIFDKPDPLEGPYFEETIYVTPARVTREVGDGLMDCARRAVGALGLTSGPVHAEIRHDGSQPWLIELAARPIGGKCGQGLRFGDDAEITLEELHLSLALGMRDEVPPRERLASGIMMIPIPRPGVLRRVGGIESALAVPNVVDIMITVPPGATLKTIPEESRYLGFIFARAESSDEVEHALRTAHTELEVEIG